MRPCHQLVFAIGLGLIPFWTLHAQVSATPVLTAAPNVLYPPIAKAAHISGDVVVTFAINPDGTTASVQAVSGPPMLVPAVVNPIRQWRFKTPLPMGTGSYFEARYTFAIKVNDDDEEDSLERPPDLPAGGDAVSLSPGTNTVTGDVHSVDGSQIVDVTAVAVQKAADRCPQDKQRTPPEKTSFSDYVELYRAACAATCPDYKVRVYRSGRVTWRGFDGVAAIGDREALIDANRADTLLNSFQAEDLWASCSAQQPADPKTLAPATSQEDYFGTYLTFSIGGTTKTIPGGAVNDTYEWAIDRAADTHRWRHADAALEPYDNIYDDLATPKPGMTLLIRATFHFNPYTGLQTFTYLDKLLQRGEPVDAADASGWTALMVASYLDYSLADSPKDNPFQMLLAAHADPNRASLHGDTALMFAAYRGVLLQPLLAHGANVNAHNADGVTPLMLLAQSVQPDAIQQALAAGADASAHDNLGRTALDYFKAASCDKPILPLPRSRGSIEVRSSPRTCPPNTPSYKQIEFLLKTAQAAATAP